jgi:uncharacterized protein
MASPIPILLKELHRLRRHLRELQTEIDLGPRVMKIQQQNLENERQAQINAHETIKQLKLKQKDDEGTLKSTELRLAKLQADLNMAGSKKEFDAKTSEIEQALAKKGELEDAILTTIGDIEQRTADLPRVDQKWIEAQAQFEQFKIDARERLDRLLEDQKATQAVLVATEKEMPPEIKGTYERLIKTYGPDGLAGVLVRSCQQCRTAITEEQRNKLINGAFVTCPNCGRGLYLME